VKQLETQVAELQKAIEVMLHNPNWRELISLSPSEIERWATAIKGSWSRCCCHLFTKQTLGCTIRFNRASAGTSVRILCHVLSRQLL
jgi:hypothetical protein